MTHKHAQHDEVERNAILGNIAEYGCHVALIEQTAYLPGFVYSIGLYYKFKQPEIICFGLKTSVMHAIINHACELIQSGVQIKINHLYKGFLEGFPIQFISVNKEYYQNYVGYAGWFYDMTFDFPLLQVIWPDKENNFPWEGNFNPQWKFKQPLLDRNIDFKFYEERNLAVFTTRQAFEGDSILYVYHDEDGAWQFHTSIEPDTADLKVVALEQITLQDPTVNEIFYLDYGESAWRASRFDEWQLNERV